MRTNIPQWTTETKHSPAQEEKKTDPKIVIKPSQRENMLIQQITQLKRQILSLKSKLEELEEIDMDAIKMILPPIPMNMEVVGNNIIYRIKDYILKVDSVMTASEEWSEETNTENEYLINIKEFTGGKLPSFKVDVRIVCGIDENKISCSSVKFEKNRRQIEYFHDFGDKLCFGEDLNNIIYDNIYDSFKDLYKEIVRGLMSMKTLYPDSVGTNRTSSFRILNSVLTKVRRISEEDAKALAMKTVGKEDWAPAEKRKKKHEVKSGTSSQA